MHRGAKGATSLLSPALYGPYTRKHLSTGMACTAPIPPGPTAHVDLHLSEMLGQPSGL